MSWSLRIAKDGSKYHGAKGSPYHDAMASIIRAPWSLHLLSPSHCSACLTTTGRPVMLWATLDHGVQLSKYDHPQLVIHAASKGGYIRQPFSSQGDTFCCRESGCAGGSMASKRSLQRFPPRRVTRSVLKADWYFRH
jgi:hypothetical protein